MEVNFLVYVNLPHVVHASSRLSVWKNVKIKVISIKKNKDKKKKARNKERKQERVTPGWTDISGPAPASFLIYKFHVLQYADLHNTIKLLHVRGTNKQSSFNTQIYFWIFYTSNDVI